MRSQKECAQSLGTRNCVAGLFGNVFRNGSAVMLLLRFRCVALNWSFGHAGVLLVEFWFKALVYEAKRIHFQDVRLCVLPMNVVFLSAEDNRSL